MGTRPWGAGWGTQSSLSFGLSSFAWLRSGEGSPFSHPAFVTPLMGHQAANPRWVRLPWLSGHPSWFSAGHHEQGSALRNREPHQPFQQSLIGRLGERSLCHRLNEEAPTEGLWRSGISAVAMAGAATILVQRVALLELRSWRAGPGSPVGRARAGCDCWDL